jgi:hypothetical protein
MPCQECLKRFQCARSRRRRPNPLGADRTHQVRKSPDSPDSKIARKGSPCEISNIFSGSYASRSSGSARSRDRSKSAKSTVRLSGLERRVVIPPSSGAPGGCPWEMRAVRVERNVFSYRGTAGNGGRRHLVPCSIRGPRPAPASYQSTTEPSSVSNAVLYGRGSPTCDFSFSSSIVIPRPGSVSNGRYPPVTGGSGLASRSVYSLSPRS